MLENFGWGSKKTADSFSGTALSPRCYESHPVLKIGKGKLYGGSASHPVVKDADVYVSLQSGSTCGRISDPWDKQTVVEVQYAIRDMEAPANVARFKKLVTWVCNQLHEGKTVHVGCIGGHGRTGTLLSAIVAEALQKEDAIQWVRKHYCKKAVESKVQIAFLMKHYGVSSVEPTKGEPTKWEGTSVRSVGTGGTGAHLKDFTPTSGVLPLLVKSRRTTEIGFAKAATKSFEPIQSARSLWKSKK